METSDMDVINTISLAPNLDTTHHLHFRQGEKIQTISLAELDRRATAIALELKDVGILPGDRVGVTGKNCVEWVLLDMAILKLGAVTAGFDIDRFQATAAIQRYGLKLMFMEQLTEHDSQILSFDTVKEWSAGLQQGDYRLPLHNGYQPDDVCAIKFTSGSTGPAKGMEAVVAGINDSLSSVQQMFEHGDGDNIFVFLRLAQLQQRYWIYSALAFHHDISLTTLDDVFPMAQAVKPTVIMGVPGFFEDVRRQLEAETGLMPNDLPARRLAVHSKFGDRLRYLWTGSAPASQAMLHFYHDCGVPIYQGYGLNETCIIAKNCPKGNRLGSVGRVLPNQSVHFDSQGILIVKSKHPIIKRYAWCKPGDNEKLFMPSGEVKTYDLGYIDEDGYLYIQGRVDDLIVLSTGRNVGVGPLEERIKLHPDIQECVLYGNGMPFVTALVSPASVGVDKESIETHIRTLNDSLWPEQKILGLIIAPEQFSIENGMLTSQYKPKRKEIYSRLASEIAVTYDRVGVPWRGAYGQ
jgi:long-subunit acyl-CoA synthetase (AMP-forming)